MIEIRDQRDPCWLWMHRRDYDLATTCLDEKGKRRGVYGIAVYTTLCYHANIAGQCWPSQTTIAHKVGMGWQEVGYVLRDLERVGLIAIEQRKGTSALYTLLKTPLSDKEVKIPTPLPDKGIPLYPIKDTPLPHKGKQESITKINNKSQDFTCPHCTTLIEGKPKNNCCPSCGAFLLPDITGGSGGYVLDLAEQIFMAYRRGRGCGGKPTKSERVDSLSYCKQLYEAGYTPEQVEEFAGTTAAQEWTRERPNWGLAYICKNIGRQNGNRENGSGQGQGQHYVPFEVVN